MFVIIKDNTIETSTEIDTTCLKDYAEDFCEHDVSYIDIDKDYFQCLIEGFPRDRYAEVSKKHYFLDSEINHCTIQQLNYMEVK